MDVWSRQELQRLVDELVDRGLINEETAESVREALHSDGFQTAIERLQATGVFSTSGGKTER
jgi:polyhydroxyalkanoate synthesis regulator phasin